MQWSRHIIAPKCSYSSDGVTSGAMVDACHKHNKKNKNHFCPLSS